MRAFERLTMTLGFIGKLGRALFDPPPSHPHRQRHPADTPVNAGLNFFYKKCDGYNMRFMVLEHITFLTFPEHGLS